MKLFLFFCAATLTAAVPTPLRDLPKEGLSFAPAGSIENAGFKLEFFHATWSGGGSAYVHDLHLKDGADWTLLNTPAERFDPQWVIFRGKLNRNNYSAAADKHWVNFTGFTLLDARNAEVTASNDSLYTLKVRFSLDRPRPELHLTLPPKTSGHHVVGLQAFAPRTAADINEVLCGPLLHAKVTGGVESQGALRMSAPSCKEFAFCGRPL